MKQRSAPKRVNMRSLILIVMLGVAGLANAAVTCTVSAVGVAFGTYDPLSVQPTESNGTVTVTCSQNSSNTQTVTANVALSAGSSGTPAQRTMLSGLLTLQYNLYVDGAYAPTGVWGDGNAGSVIVTDLFMLSSSIKSGTTANSIYGKIPAAQTSVAPGSYSDTITVTVNY